MPARKSNALVLAILGGLVLVNLYVFVWDKHTSIAAIKETADNTPMEIHGSAENLEPPPPGPVTPSTVDHDAGSAGSATMAPAPGHLDGKLSRGTLGHTLKNVAHLPASDVDEIIRALQPVLDFKTIRAGEAFHIDRLSDGRIRDFELDLGKGGRAHATRDTAGTLVGSVDR